MIYTQMNTLEGVKGGKYVLSLKVIAVQFQFYFLIDNKEAKTIVNKLNEIQHLIGIDNYKKLLICKWVVFFKNKCYNLTSL